MIFHAQTKCTHSDLLTPGSLDPSGWRGRYYADPVLSSWLSPTRSVVEAVLLADLSQTLSCRGNTRLAGMASIPILDRFLAVLAVLEMLAVFAVLAVCT